VPTRAHAEYAPIPESTKERFILWVEDIGLIRKNSIDKGMFASIVRSGVFLCDLINRVEGKNEIIKGIHRQPKNRTAALTNIKKALDYFKKFPKMNSRYLWDPE
jgi:hypothetical protein